jgi:hypothetical protein
LTTWDYLNRELISTGKRLAQFLNEKEWYPVDSFFGGFAIYKRDSILDTRYSGKINSLVLQKVLEHNEIENIFQRPQYQSCLKEISINYQKYYDYIVNGIFPSDNEIYTCEHIIFNLTLKAKGFDKLYINSKLKRPSKSRYNF